MKKNQLRMKIEAAKQRLVIAEEAMSLGLRQMEPGLLGDKTMINAALNTAFAEVSAAKRELVDLEELVVSEA